METKNKAIHHNTNTGSVKNKNSKQNRNKNKKVKYYHSFLTIILLALVVQISYSALLNISKIVIYETKITKAKELKTEAENKNKTLKNELENFNSMQKVESIARNNLKMAGEDEVLLIINEKKEQEEIPMTNKDKFFRFFEEKIAKKFVQQDGPNATSLFQ